MQSLIEKLLTFRDDLEKILSEYCFHKSACFGESGQKR